MGLLDKYLSGRPTYRCCEQLKPHGLPLSPGTRTEGLQKIAVLFAPGMTKRYERRRRAKRFHGDETRWEVCEAVDGQTGHRWYRWVRQSASVVLYRMAPGRGAEVPQAPCAKRHQDLVDVVLVGDRYRADTGLAKAGDARMLAFCWAHGRRDVLKAARRGPALDRGMGAWIDDSRERSRLKAARLAGGDETWRLEPQPAPLVARHRNLETPRSQRQARGEAHLHEPDLPLLKPKVLSSLHTHWDGLPVVVGRPEVAMDNKSAERRRRTPVVGRKNYDGSGSVWSAHLAARMFRGRQTVWLWGLKPPHGRSAFLHACAEKGGKSPTDLSAFLPWQMAPERREERARPVPVTLPPCAGLCQEREEPEATHTS
jgi:transposase